MNAIAVPTRRWIIRGTWDRLQIPMPFCRIHIYFAEPLRPREQETVEQYRQRIEDTLNKLEMAHDPQEHQIGIETGQESQDQSAMSVVPGER